MPVPPIPAPRRAEPRRPDPVGADEPDTVALLKSEVDDAAAEGRPTPPTPPPTPAPGQTPAIGWAALAACATTGVVLLVTALTALPFGAGSAYATSAENAAQVFSAFPTLLMAAGWATLAVGARAPRAGTAVAALVLAVVTVSGGLVTSKLAAPGPLSAALSAAAGALVLAAPRATAPPVPFAGFVRIAPWWTGASAVGALWCVVAAGEVGSAPPSTVGGAILLLVVTGLGVWLWAGGSAVLDALPARWVLAASWVATLLACLLADPYDGSVWPLLAVHGAVAVLVLLVPDTIVAGGPDALLRGAERARGRLVALPPAWLAAGVAAVAMVAGLVVALGGAAGYGGPTSGADVTGDGSTGTTVLVVLVGVLALAATATPTMPWYWRAGLALGAAVSFGLAWTGTGASDTSDVFVLVVLLPAVLVGSSVWGVVVNRRSGATSTSPGWVGQGTPPPPVSVPLPVAPTAGARSRLCLHGDTALDPAAVLETVRRVTAVRGNWFLVRSEHVTVKGAAGDALELGIGGHCSFRARVERRDGRTVLRVGGMDRWLQSRSYWAGFVPAGPAHVQGWFLYTLYLRTVVAELARLDGSARLAVTAPGQAPIA